MKDGAQAGPATTEEVKNLITTGAIKADTLVWREGLAAWSPANTQSEFAGTAAPAAPPPAPGAAGAGKPGVFTPDPADVEKNKVMGVLAYLGLLFLVPLLAAKESPFARYHTNQGLILFLTWIACFIVGSIIPFVGWFLIIPLTSLCLFVLMILGIVNAAQGACKPLPVIGTLFTIIK
jgi:uncharacterized membrane protein